MLQSAAYFRTGLTEVEGEGYRARAYSLHFIATSLQFSPFDLLTKHMCALFAHERHVAPRSSLVGKPVVAAHDVNEMSRRASRYTG